MLLSCSLCFGTERWLIWQASWTPWIERHVALGLVVTAGARMEDILRYCYCSLDGGENARIVAAGQDVSWLIEYCRALAEANPRIPRANKDAINAVLKTCKEASTRRNELMHGVHFTVDYGLVSGPLAGFIANSRRRKSAQIKELAVSEIHTVWQDMCVATDELYRAVNVALDPSRELGKGWMRTANSGRSNRDERVPESLRVLATGAGSCRESHCQGSARSVVEGREGRRP